MRISNLKNIDLVIIVDCLLESFKDYFVKMPEDVAYWRNRYKAASVDFEFSYGAFDGDKLVAFIINGINIHNGKLAAFNTGTGVIEAYRGQQLVDKIYNYALPFFKEKGIEKCMLEVIQANARAIRVYERIGFHIVKDYKCFNGNTKKTSKNIKVESIDFEDILKIKNTNEHFYSWDNMNIAIQNAGNTYDKYWVKKNNDEKVGYFVINPQNGNLAQIESFTGDLSEVFGGVSKISEKVRINNVDSRRVEIVEQFLTYGLINPINQYEMEMMI